MASPAWPTNSHPLGKVPSANTSLETPPCTDSSEWGLEVFVGYVVAAGPIGEAAALRVDVLDVERDVDSHVADRAFGYAVGRGVVAVEMAALGQGPSLVFGRVHQRRPGVAGVELALAGHLLHHRKERRLVNGGADGRVMGGRRGARAGFDPGCRIGAVGVNAAPEGVLSGLNLRGRECAVNDETAIFLKGTLVCGSEMRHGHILPSIRR